MQKRVLILLSLATLSLSSCATAPPNEKVCIRLSVGAVCTYTLDGPRSRMTEPEYKTQEVGQIFMRPGAWGSIRTFIEQVCQKEKTCDLSKIKSKLDFIENEFFLDQNIELEDFVFYGHP